MVSGDLVSEFILSGFNSFQAMSAEPCKPYDARRNGINIGEAVASILVTKSTANLSEDAVELLGDSSINDANHISGPSRTGEGLSRSITIALKEAMKSKDQLSLTALRAIKSAILLQKTQKSSSTNISNEDEMKILQKLVKQRKDSADIYLTVRSPKEVYKSNRSYRIVNGEANHGGSINVSSDKYYRETFFASVHTRNLSIPQVPVTNTSGSVGEGQGYNR